MEYGGYIEMCLNVMFQAVVTGCSFSRAFIVVPTGVHSVQT